MQIRNLVLRLVSSKTRRLLAALLAPPLLLLIIMPALYADAAAARDGAAGDPETAVSDAWNRAQQAVSYAFTADVTQSLIPEATVANAGRSSSASRYYMEGSAEPRAGMMDLTLWGDGGSVLDLQSGIHVRVEGNQVQARQGERGEWQTLDNFGTLFAPEGDFMSFLFAADAIVAHAAPHGMTRYTFTIDGPRFGAFMRQTLQEQMVHAGELPPNTVLEVPPLYAQMSGHGELWIGADGLPRRQEIHLDFPEAVSPQEGMALAVDSIITFSDYQLAADQPTLTATVTTAAAAALPGVLPAAALLLLIGVLLVHGRSRFIYAAFAIGLSLSMLLTPVLQTVHAARVENRRALRQAMAAAQQEESDLAQAIDRWQENRAAGQTPAGALAAIRADDGADSDGDGYSDVVEQLAGAPEAAAPEMDALAVGTMAAVDEVNPLLIDEQCMAIVDGGYTAADADGDGLSDYEECLLGTSSATSTIRDGVNPDGADSDGDLIPDLWEVEGWSYAGERWYTDPLEADSNFDSLPDTLEWEVDGNGDGLADDDDGDGIPNMRDTDGDGTPDLFDEDNDGDGVPDYLDNSPFTTSAQPIYDGDGFLTGYEGQVFDAGTPLTLQLDNTNSGLLTFVEFQLRPTNPDNLWYAFNVLDWPQHDRRGQMQDDDNLTFRDLHDGGQAAANDDFGDIKLIPMLEIRVPDGRGLPAPALLAEYGISLQEDEGGQLAYVPLQIVADNRGDSKAAFYGKMLYLPGANWDAAQEINLVWMVQALIDRCASYEYSDSSGETRQGSDCQEYETRNVLEVIHVYANDPWYLTGLNIREDHGVDFAILFEDPAVDPDLNDDEALIQLAQGFDYTFLNGLDCGDGDACQADGERDITVGDMVQRWNRTTNTAVSLAERWEIPNILRVQEARFDTIDRALATIAMTTTVDLLDTYFDLEPLSPITPTLLFAREERYRAATLDSPGSVISWQESRLTVNMDPAQVPLDVLAGVNLSAYANGADGWQNLTADELWAAIGARYQDEFADQETAVADGMLVAVQLYYTSLLRGVNRVVETNGALLAVNPTYQIQEKTLGEKVLKGLGTAAKTIAGKFILAGAAGISPLRTNHFFEYLRDVFNNSIGNKALDTWLKVRDRVSFITEFSGWRLNLTVGAIGAGVVLIVGLAIGLSFALGGEGVGRVVLASIIGVVLTAALLYGPIMELKAAVKGAEGLAKSLKALGSLNALSKASKAAGVIGLVVGVGLAVGVFIYQWIDGGLEPGSQEFNYLLAAAFAAIVIAVLIFVLSLTIVGSIIVSLLAIVDIVLMIAGVDFSVTAWLTEKLTDYYYSYEPIFDSDIALGSINMSLDDPERGLSQGATFSYQTEITTSVVMTDPNWQAAFYVGTSFFNEDDFDDTVFIYSLRPYADVFTGEEIAAGSSVWTIVEDRSWGLADLYRGDTLDEVSVSGIGVPVGINQSPAFYLNSGYDMPAYECWGQNIFTICYTESLTGTSFVNLGANMYYDIFPETINDFMTLDWAGDGQSFPQPVDHDGDGLPANGLDPNDADWDADDDGLADGYEIELRGHSREDGGFPISYLAPDTDGDGLCDRDEIRHGTDPSDRDTDGDGLEDSEEVLHRDCATGAWRGGWEFVYLPAAVAPDGQDHSRRIFSNPLKPDEDGDGFNDRIEKLIHESDPARFPFHPAVYNDSPGGLYPEVSETDGVLAPGQSVDYTVTVRNNFPDPFWVYGGITVTIPAALGSGVYREVTYDPDGPGGQGLITDDIFNLYPQNTAVLARTLQVSPAADNGVHTITNELRAQLSDSGDVSYDWILNRFPLTLDTPPGGYTPWASALTPAPADVGWGAPYLLAAVESDDLIDPLLFDVVLYQLDEGIGSRTVVDSFIMEPNDIVDYGVPAVDIACAADGDCLVAYTYFATGSGGVEGLQLGGAQVDPAGIVSGSRFSIGELAMTDTNYRQDLRAPVVATDGSRFWLAYQSDTYTGGTTDLNNSIQARAVFNDGTLGAPSRVDVNDTASPSVAETDLDLIWIGGERLMITWSAPDGADDRVHKALLSAAATLIAGSYEQLPLAGDMSQAAYAPALGRGLILLRERAPQQNDQQRIFAYFVENGMVSYGFRPAGSADPDDELLAPTVAYDVFNNGWIIAWLGRAGDNYTLYYTSYNADDTQARLIKQPVPLETIHAAAQLDAVCHPQPPVTDLTDCRISGVEHAAAGTMNRLFWQKVILQLDSPFYGAFNNEAALDLIVDADAPTSSFVNLPTHVRPQEVVIIGGEATDATSSVTRVEVRVEAGLYEPTAAGAGAASWVYALDTGAAEGLRAISVRAVDAAGNVQPSPTTGLIVVDGSAPQTAVSTADGAVLTAQRRDDGTWVVPLSGSVTDPLIAGRAGSGVASLEIALVPPTGGGRGWEPVTWDGSGGWQFDYPLAGPTDAPNPESLTGPYTIRLRAVDALGNSAEQTAATIGVDLTPPSVSLDTIDGTTVSRETRVVDHPLIFNETVNVTVTVPAAITTTALIQGGVAETGGMQSGIAGVEYSYTPLDFLVSPHAETAVAAPFWQPAAVNGATADSGSWSTAVPAGLEGFFQLDLRGTDAAGNRSAAADWPHWWGEIDTAAPRVTATVTYGGWASTARTEYAVTVEDLNLVEDAFLFDACLPPGSSLSDANREYYRTAWGDAFLAEPRLARINVSCFTPGLITTGFRVQGCDAFGRCTGQDLDPDFNFYVADNSGTLTRTDSQGANAESAAEFPTMNQPVYAIDDGLITYVAYNGSPAAAVQQSRLDGSGDQLLARLLPGGGGAYEPPLPSPALDFTDDYGDAVAISDDGLTMVVSNGNIYNILNGADAAVYVFEWDSASGWTLANTLTSERADNGSLLNLSAATSVAVNADGSVIVIGTTAHDTAGVENAGGVIVYTRPGTSWSDGLGQPVPVASLVASDPVYSGGLGHDVAIAGDTVVAGRFSGDTVYLFSKPAAGWSSESETARLTLPASGLDVRFAIDNERIAVAHSSGAYLYRWDGFVWALETTLPGAAGPGVALSGTAVLVNNDLFRFDGGGWLREVSFPVAADSVALQGETAVLADTAAGAAVVYGRDQAGWREQLTLTPADGRSGDAFGDALALVDGIVAVGAPEAGSVGQGRLYLYEIAVDNLVPPAPTSENDAAAFGRAVAVDGDTLVVGGPLARRPGTAVPSGVVEVYTRRGNVWYWQQTLYATDGQSSDQFGMAVAVDGDTILVGAPNALDNGVRKGAAYIFTRSGGIWTEQEKLVNSRSEAGYFGSSVGVAGDTAVIGAPNNRSFIGEVYVYTRSGAAWITAAVLSSSAAQGGSAESFGWDVAIDGDLIAAVPLMTETAYLFIRPGGGWSSGTETARLQVSGEQLDSVAVSGDTVAAGGLSLHLFTRPTGGWAGTLAPQHSADETGIRTVALDGDQLVAGAAEGAWVYTRDSDGVWSGAAPLAAEIAGIDFGQDVALSGGIVVVGADQLNDSTGAVFAFDSVTVSAVDAAADVVIWAQESAAGQTIWSQDGRDGGGQRALLAGPTTDRLFRDVLIDESSSVVYWSEYDASDPARGRIRRADLADGGNAVTVIADGPRPHSLALNALDEKIYWTADLDGTVNSANLNGSGAQVLYDGLNGPADIALLPAERAIYWTEQAAGVEVRRGDLAGSAAAVVYTLPGSTIGIAIDQNYLPVATDQSVSTAVNQPVPLALDAYDPDSDPLTLTILSGPGSGTLTGGFADLQYTPAPDFSGADTFTYQVADGRGGSATAVITITVGGARPAGASGITAANNTLLQLQALADYTPPPRDSIIFSPADGTVLTTPGAVTVSGAAYARQGLQGVILFVDNTVIAAIPYNGVITDTTWSAGWTPPGDGRYVLESMAIESGSIAEGDRTPIMVIVDTAPPAISIDSTWITRALQVSGPVVEVHGSASDLAGVSRVEFSFETPGQGYSPWQVAEYDAASGRWRTELSLGTLVDGQGVFVRARAIDFAGNTAETGDAIAADLLPPTAVAWSIVHNGVPLTAGDLVPQAQATLQITWAESSDGSGFVDYVAGWSSSPDPADPWLDSGSYNGAGQHTFVAAEAQKLYAHLRLVDASGNARVETRGPVYVDGPLTPDLVADLADDRWRQNDHTLLSVDYEIKRRTPPSGALHQPQRLYGSWDENGLRLAWQGADWDRHGDLFIYLDTAGGGATAAYDPYTPAGPVVALPNGFGADYAVWVQGSVTATLLAWGGGSWAPLQALDGASYQFDVSDGAATTDLWLPFSMLGIVDPAAAGVGLVAVASEEGTLRFWAAAPDQNPLNSASVVEPGAEPFTGNGYALTQAFIWPAAGDGVAPNGGMRPGSDLQLQVAAAPAGVTAGYLASDWLDQLQPGTPLDNDLDGVPDMILPAPAAPFPLGDGSLVTVTLTVENRGTETAVDVEVSLTPRGALVLDTASPILVGDIPAGEMVAVQITGHIDTALGGAASELSGVVSDARHGPFEWFWVHHPVDIEPPTGLALTEPISYVTPFANNIAGVVTDPSGVDTIGVMIRTIPGGEEGFTICTDPTPYDGVFQCAIDLGAQNGSTGFALRIQATDTYGHTGPWTSWREFTIDDTPPQVTVETAVDLLLQDGYLSEEEGIWQGILTDDFAPQSVEACINETCVTATATAGPWQLALPLPAGDGVETTVSIIGRDAAQNLSTPLTQTVMVDTVPPLLTVAQSAGADMLLAGTIRDGGGVAELYAQITGPEGTVWTAVPRTGETWQLSGGELSPGIYMITLQAYDRAGNVRSYGPIAVTFGAAGHELFLPVITISP